MARTPGLERYKWTKRSNTWAERDRGNPIKNSRLPWTQEPNTEQQQIIKIKMVLYSDKAKQGIQSHTHSHSTNTMPESSPQPRYQYTRRLLTEFVNITETK